MKNHDQIRTEILGLRDRLRKKLDIYFEPATLQSVLDSKLASKALDEIEGIVGTYSLEELLIASEVNAEIDASSGGEGASH